MAIRKSDIYRSLWDSGDQLRCGMDASLYKDYILTLLFVSRATTVPITTSIGVSIRLSATGGILPFDTDAAKPYADIAAARRASGRPIADADCQIVAIARATGASVVTRNVKDFAGCGVEILDPWSDRRD